ncbi:polysaccharide biosynthesis/export family protein [Oceanotoga sp. DSM 15011]|uniref:polysaccharide biosynthesis/export family protein n=1 Tax=Oceanotoga sp. DSM 15011 TaxID=2984951 RepID=UPI0021F46EF9|nr:polysaccharide biosynthesis/export family protein [Oceanotoga sp. DSM 15011]UYO98878.1 polysaccharide biosynthesis/export family protein [Oceanotoga sp. DSM 15011]
MKKTKLIFLAILLLPIIAFTYNLRVGDVLGVWVFGYPDYSSNSIYVGPDGNITIPPIGRINVEGKNIEQVEKIINEKIKDYIKSAKVTVGIVNYAPFKVNILGNVVKNGMLDIKTDKIKLSDLIAMVGGLREPSKSSKAIIKYSDGNEKTVNIDWILKGENGENPYIYEDTFVIIPYEFTNKVNLFSDFGTYSLDYYEGLTLKTLISESKISSDRIDDEITIIRDDEISKYSFEQVITKEDIQLKSEDTIIIKKAENYVYVISETNSSKVPFEKNEDMTLKILLMKLGINPSYVDEVTIEDKEIKLNEKLQNKSFINIKMKKNYVYLTGAFNYSGRMGFEFGEDMTLIKLISLAKGFNTEFSGNITLINPDGSTKNLYINPANLQESNEINILPGSTLIAQMEEKIIYVMGDISKIETYKNGDTLYDFVLRNNLNNSYTLRYRIENEEKEIDLENIESLKEVPLKGKVFIELTKEKNDQVIVYKEGNMETINKNIVRLQDVVAAVGGFAPVDDGNIKVMKNGEQIANYTQEDIINNPLIQIPKGSYVVVQPEAKYSYITVMGNIAPRSIRTDVPLSLVEILAGTSIKWEFQNNIILYPINGNKTMIDISNIEELRNKFVEPGSIVYVPDVENIFVYVFGEVSRPGIVQYIKGMTTVEAILKSGNITKSAELGSVYLFKEGPENAPVKLDISGVINAAPLKTGMNPELKPGDIIYVPKNAITNVLEVVSTVTTFMNFVDKGLDIYGKVK